MAVCKEWRLNKNTHCHIFSAFSIKAKYLVVVENKFIFNETVCFYCVYC